MSQNKIVDLVPSSVRQQWADLGYYSDQSIYTLFAEKAVTHPQKAAVVSAESTISYKALHDYVLSLANSLHKIGCGEGDVLAYQLLNSWKCCALDLASACLGMVVVPYPQGKDNADILSILKRSCAIAIVTDDASVSAVNNLLSLNPSLCIKHRIVDADRAPKGWVKLSEMLTEEAIGTEKIHRQCAALPARFIISSGTEANPKLVAYSHRALLGGRGRFIEKLTRNDNNIRALYLVPFGSAFGSSATAGILAVLGETLVTIPRFDVRNAIHAVDQLSASHLFGVPTMYQRMMQDDSLISIKKSNLRLLVSGGALVDTATVQRCKENFGCAFVSLYGSADGINCHTDPTASTEEMIGNVGIPDESICAIRIVDEKGRILPANKIGEIICRGPMTPMQYVNAPELDKQYRNNEGWVMTGDLGYLDHQGYLVLSGRKKDIIIRGGLNISPVQIENIVTAHPDVLGCACIGIPDADLGERVCVCLMLREQSRKISLHQLRHHIIGSGLERGKLPDYLLLKRQLPLNAAGKVDKKAIAIHISSRFFSAGVPS